MDVFVEGRETFAAYFARYLIARKGYQPVAPPEAAELVEACDFVLTKADGMSFAIAAIVDRQAHPQKTFALSAEAVDALAVACLRYVGKVNGAQMPASVNIYEIGPGAADAETVARLAPYRRRSVFSKALTFAFALDTTSGRAWANLSWLARRLRLPDLESLLRGPRLSEAELVAPAPPQLAPSGPPVITYALLALLAVLFGCELAFGLDPAGSGLAPSIRTLVALGGVSRSLVFEHGEWWRIFTAPLLHGSLVHLAFNGLALFLVGRLLERLTGPAWFAGLFAVSAVCGSLMSLTVNPANIVGIGASGGIVGLFAAALVVAIRLPSGIMRSRLVSGAIQSLLPALIPFINAATSGSQIDYGAHFGGAIGGALAALLLLPLWPAERLRPRLQGVAALVAAVFFLIAAGSLLPVARGYRLETQLAPSFPGDRAAQEAQADELLRAYPQDPRVRLVHALKLLKQNDIAGAQEDLRAGLAQTDLLTGSLPPDIEMWLRTVLAATLVEEGKGEEGRQIAGPTCAAARKGPLAGLVQSDGLCP